LATRSRPLRLLKAERELLKEVLGEFVTRPGPERGVKTAQSILDKIELAELVKPKKESPPGLGWENAATAMRSVLGPALATPPNPDDTWRMKMSGRIKSLGLTFEDCRMIAAVLSRRGWKTYSFEKAIWEADRLLAEAGAPTVPQPKRSGPLGVDD
jgi:hypothetical protein